MKQKPETPPEVTTAPAKKFPITQYHLLRKVFDYIDFKELLCRVVPVSKAFLVSATHDKYFADRLCAQLSFVALDPSLSQVLNSLSAEDPLALAKQVLSPGAEDQLPLVPYYTDGGVYSEGYFITNLFNKGENLYSTTRGDNVHVCCVCTKAFKCEDLYTPDMQSHVVPATLPGYTDPCYHLKYEETQQKYETAHPHFSCIHGLSLCRTGGYTCFMNSFAVFVSMKPISPAEEVVSRFKDVNNLEKARNLGLPIKSTQAKLEGTFIEFSCPATPGEIVHPLLFGAFDPQFAEINEIAIKQRVAFRYMLITLIDSRKNNDHNIDAYHFLFSGSYIDLQTAHK